MNPQDAPQIYFELARHGTLLNRIGKSGCDFSSYRGNQNHN